MGWVGRPGVGMSSEPFIVPANARSWVPVPEGSHFPIQNLPFCEERAPSSNAGMGILVRIGDHALNLLVLQQVGLLPVEFGSVENLDQSQDELRQMRRLCFELLEEGNETLRGDEPLRRRALRAISTIKLGS